MKFYIFEEHLDDYHFAYLPVGEVVNDEFTDKTYKEYDSIQECRDTLRIIAAEKIKQLEAQIVYWERVPTLDMSRRGENQ